METAEYWPVILIYVMIRDSISPTNVFYLYTYVYSIEKSGYLNLWKTVTILCNCLLFLIELTWVWWLLQYFNINKLMLYWMLIKYSIARSKVSNISIHSYNQCSLDYRHWFWCRYKLISSSRRSLLSQPLLVLLRLYPEKSPTSY